ncbi:Trigger factor [Candidatus Fokinia solitaria]|uniref:Trigger factor n=1 Tax=Candidatus Fokinia solitaria TaxID=1802984 RepID=A0A2U8BT21_9RICK|nr:trigger factor [Candidatus Fokinia solitaria]AWD33514.1 Trigger factor [Candidatus Fokinia solitaria]
MKSTNFEFEKLHSNGVEVEYKITVTDSEMNKNIENKILELSQNYKLHGFREGKVPLAMVRKKEIEGVTSQYIRELIAEGINQLHDKGEIDTSSRDSRIELVEMKQDGVTVKVTGTVPIKVDVKKMLHDKKIEFLSLDKSEAIDTSEAEQTIVRQLAKEVPQDKDYKAKKGDTVVLDLTGKLMRDKEEIDFDGLSGTGVSLKIGDNYFVVPGFEDSLIGLRTGDVHLFEGTFPMDYHDPQIKGKKVRYHITVTSVLSVQEESHLDDAFATQMGFSNVQEFRAMLQTDIMRRYDNIISLINKKRLLDFCADSLDFKPSAEMIAKEKDNIVSEYKEAILAKDGEEGLDKAVKNMLKVSIIIGAVVREKHLAVSEEEMKEKMEQVLKDYPQSAQKFKEMETDPTYRTRIKASILEQKVVDFMMTLTNAASYKQISFKEIKNYENEMI